MLAEVYESGFMSSLMSTPRVMGTTIEDSGGTIPVNYPIQVVFDLSMDRASVESALQTDPGFAYTIEWFEADMVMEIVPTANPEPGGQYTVTISAGVISSFGLPMQQGYTFIFNIAAG
jgi:hypothetical protein